MKLFIDLKKAVSQTPNTSVDTPSEDQSTKEYDSSFKKRPIGVAAGEEEDPEKSVSKAQPFDGGFTSDEAKRAADSLGVDFSKEAFSLSEFISGINEEREHGDVSQAATTLGKIALAHLKEDPKYYKKLSKMAKSVDFLKSLNTKLEYEKVTHTPNVREQEFLREVLGYSQEEINKGVAVITGRNRNLFSRWLCDRLANSTSDLMKSVGAKY